MFPLLEFNFLIFNNLFISQYILLRMEWHSLKKGEVLTKLDTSKNGLNSKEAEERLKRYGKNIIEDDYKINYFKMLFLQFKSALIYILLSAAIISFFIKHYLDGSIILAVIFINASIGFFQQFKAEKAILELKKIIAPKCRVIRDGKHVIISSNELVPGDIIFLEEGDHISADSRVLESESLEINEAILTGESFPVEKISSEIKNGIPLAERKNMLYAGTIVEKGRGYAVIVSTGKSTEFGKIAAKLEYIETEETPMQKKMNKFAKQIAFAVIVICLVLTLLIFVRGTDKYQIFLLIVSLGVSAIPEGLPAIITVSLALASKRMLIHRVILRRLSAAESLGSVTVICSDKTGTLTEEKMFVSNLFANNKSYQKTDSIISFKNKKVDLQKEKSLYSLIKTGVLCNNARFEIVENSSENKYEIIGDHTESALVALGLDLGINRKTLSESEPRIKEISFNSSRKMMSILRKGERKNILYTKGSSEAVINKCSYELIEGTNEKLDYKRKKELIKKSEEMEALGLRVLAFAYKITRDNETAETLEENLIFLGFMGMEDPPRKEVKSSIEQCKKAGIKIKMITGDSALTAKSIASQIGITGKIVTSLELEKMSDEELKKEIDSIAIFARITPEQKLRIVGILQTIGEEVAITGDGVNDVLALKKADIGVAMGKRGSDVAREVSDIVLMDDNFNSISYSVEEGRNVYDNIKKVTKFLLAVNFSEILLVTFCVLLGYPLPFLPVQILWMNLVTDTIVAFGLLYERDDKVMSTKPRKEKSILDNIFWFIIIAGIVTFLAEVAVFLLAFNNYPIEKVRTIVITEDILFELFFIFACRSNKTLKEIGFFSNKVLIGLVSAMVLLQIFILYSPINYLFSFIPLSLNEWLMFIPFSLSGLIIFEIGKYVISIRNRNKKEE